ncbi:hypothetical protein EAF04_006801 [Stromatinia cepivora]|nr:hypothetical protein EAF04_006801 [Stromatinia cepivora]
MFVPSLRPEREMLRNKAIATNFIAARGPQGYGYNVVCSEFDELLFRHAGESGAHIYDGFNVTSVDFVPSNLPQSTDPECMILDPSRPASLNWTNKNGTSGVVNFDYLVDASGRQGLMSTKYLKNCKMNPGEQLQSITNCKAIYLDTLKHNTGMRDLLVLATLVSDIKSPSDWSYDASAYACPYVRIAGDAGCFVNPFFSSGVYLALNAGLSAATTICASIRGQVSELAAATWYSKKVAASYARFLVVVSSTRKQILGGEEPVIADYDEKSFERAFQLFRPVIQGSVDVSANLSQAEVMRTLNFCLGALASNNAPEHGALLENLRSLAVSDSGAISDEKYRSLVKEAETVLTAEQLDYLNLVRKNETIIPDDIISLDSTGFDVLDEFSANLIFKKTKASLTFNTLKIMREIWLSDS